MVQPFLHTDLARLDAGFLKAYGWGHFDLPGGSEKDGTPYRVIAYAKDHDGIAQESALFAVRDYDGGLALLTRLEKEPGKQPQLSEGTDMCGTLQTMLASADAGGPAPADEDAAASDGQADAPQTHASTGSTA